MTTLIAEFTVVGTPVPQGSARAFVRGGKPRIVAGNAGPLEKWRGDIRSAWLQLCAAGKPAPVDGPISMRLSFRMPRPKSHYLPVNRTRLAPELRPDAPEWAIGKPDGDKLLRAVFDALTGVAYVDDAQVVVIGATQKYANPGEQPGVDVRVSAL